MNAMKTKTMKMNKLAAAVLALSLTQGVSAAGETSQHDVDNTGTYWGIGIGSVLGAVIAGPPGAAIGATLFGSIGWGQGMDTALDQSLIELDRRDLALEQSQAALHKNRSDLTKARQKVSELNRSNGQQSAVLADLMENDGNGEQGNNVLQDVTEHYAQEVYFRNGESDVPVYAQGRIDKLSEFLKSHPNLNVTLKGYTDHRGDAEFNAALAQSRVDGIREALLEQGLDTQRVTALAIGEVASQTLPSDAANYVLDRRVSIELSFNKQDELNSEGLVNDEELPIARLGEVFP